MIELIYNEEESVVTGERELLEPKNVKQIGEPRNYKKIFLEDFVHTFLLQYKNEPKIGVLLGKSERSGGKRYLYIKSALPLERVAEKQGKYFFSEKLWGEIYQNAEMYFPEQEILGWFLATPGFAVEKTSVIEETHRTYFSGAEKVLFLAEPVEGESAFFGFDGNRFSRQPGYYIYYEKNEPMRDYLVNKNGAREKNSSSERTDVAMANFRKILKEKQEKNIRRKKLAVSYGTKVAVAMVLFVGAVALKNKTDVIEDMKHQMSTLSVPVDVVETAEEDVMVEELPGNVEEQECLPVENAQEENIQEENIQEENAQEENVSEENAPEHFQEQVPITENMTSEPDYQQYTIQKGDTLAKVSRDYYGNDDMVAKICELNEIENGDYIQVGEIILLP